MRQSIDVILLTYKPDKRVLHILKALEQQTYPVRKIIIINTEEAYFTALMKPAGLLERYPNIEVHHITAEAFDHGGTRQQAVMYSNADIFVCMTQDAVPADKNLIKQLAEALEGTPNAAVAYARQLPRTQCREIERYTRSFNYPDQSAVKSIEDIERLGIKTFFCSNVCAAYNRRIFDKLDGFVSRAIFNEDMIYAAKAVQNHFKIVYAAKAQVIHSHNYTCMQQFRRNFDLGVSQAQHPEVFAGVSSQSEGMQLVKQTAKHLIESKKKRLIPMLILSSAYKYLGYQFGMHYKCLPYGIIRWCTSNPRYWKNAS